MKKTIILTTLSCLIGATLACGPLHEAAKRGDVGRIRELLRGDTEVIDATDENGWTPLHWAASEGHTIVAKTLLAGANVNAATQTGHTPLHYAAKSNSFEIIVMLLKAGALIDAATKKEGWTPLHDAAYKGHPRIVIILLNAGANHRLINYVGYTPLQYAQQKKHHEIIKIFKSHGQEEGEEQEEDVPPVEYGPCRGKGKRHAKLLTTPDAGPA